jgi:formate hydrogenlyase subunit 6/NADH:ubiquinone oxidoreductase subunit I
MNAHPGTRIDPARPVPTASIDEARCIGCTLCIQACPFDAIVGAARHMHTVIEAMCTGCELCVPPCPVDCITMIVPAGRVWTREHVVAAGAQVKAHKRRLERERAERETRLASRASVREAPPDLDVDEEHVSQVERISSIVQRAVRRAGRSN